MDAKLLCCAPALLVYGVAASATAWLSTMHCEVLYSISYIWYVQTLGMALIQYHICTLRTVDYLIEKQCICINRPMVVS